MTEPGADLAPLSTQDQHHLGQLERKLQLVRDRTASVASGYILGLYLYGEGGVGKSHTVLQALQHHKAHYILTNSRMTGRGLFNILESSPDAIHVLEDMEQLTRDRGAQGVLRSALWGQRREGDRGPMEREVTWITFRGEHRFIFTGGIIMTGNRPLPDLPELDALRTRMVVLHLQPSGPELQAKMRQIALRGYEHDGKQLRPEECAEVCEYVIARSLSLNRQLDLRMLIHGFQDRLQWEENDSGSHWRDLVASQMHGRVTAFREEVNFEGRDRRKQREQEIVRSIEAQSKNRQERLRLWAEQTGKSPAAYYRRRSDLCGAEGAVDGE
jgi:hypothetical protein